MNINRQLILTMIYYPKKSSKRKRWNFSHRHKNVFFKYFAGMAQTVRSRVRVQPMLVFTCSNMWIIEARLPFWLSKWSAGVAPRGESWGIHCMQVRKQACRHPFWLWNPGQTSPEVKSKSRVSVAPQKRTCVLQKFLKKIKIFQN